MKKLNIAVIFGGTNTEHEISIITALQAMHALKDAGHHVTPVYISKSGEWYLGNESLLNPERYRNLNRLTQQLKITRFKKTNDRAALMATNVVNQEKTQSHIDAAFPIFHGKYGEDGAIHGFLKMLDIPTIGSTLSAASTGMDKHISKCIAQSLNIPVVPDIFVTHAEYVKNKPKIIQAIQKLSDQVIIKPVSLGSSIGISIAKNRSELINALEVAFTFDHRVLIEKLLKDPIEVQISIMGNGPYELSVTEQPLPNQAVYSYEEKYLKGGKKTGGSKGMASASRKIPAPITKSQDKLIREYSIKFYQAISGQGLSRLDYLIDEDRIYFNEINVIPGSLAFYLWEKSGYPFPKLVQKLIDLGLQSHRQESKTVKTFDTNILTNFTLPAQK
jgi:D-alanine-D-alanine ligase